MEGRHDGGVEEPVEDVVMDGEDEVEDEVEVVDGEEEDVVEGRRRWRTW